MAATTTLASQSVGDHLSSTVVTGGVPYSTDDIVAATFGPVEPAVAARPPQQQYLEGYAGNDATGLSLYDYQGRSQIASSGDPLRISSVSRVSYTPPVSSSYYYTGAPSNPQSLRYPISNSVLGYPPPTHFNNSQNIGTINRVNVSARSSYTGHTNAVPGITTNTRTAQQLLPLTPQARRDTQGLPTHTQTTRAGSSSAVLELPQQQPQQRQSQYSSPLLPTYHVSTSNNTYSRANYYSPPGNYTGANVIPTYSPNGRSYISHMRSRGNVMIPSTVGQISGASPEPAYAAREILGGPYWEHEQVSQGPLAEPPGVVPALIPYNQIAAARQPVTDSSLVPLGAVVPPGTVIDSLQPRRRKFLIKRHTAGCCGAFNRVGTFDRPAGACSALNCHGCCDREHITYAPSQPATLSEDGSIEGPRRAIRSNRLAVCRGGPN